MPAVGPWRMPWRRAWPRRRANCHRSPVWSQYAIPDLALLVLFQAPHQALLLALEVEQLDLVAEVRCEALALEAVVVDYATVALGALLERDLGNEL